MPDDDSTPAQQDHRDPADRIVVVDVHDGTVIPVPGPWDHDVIQRAAAALARKYIAAAR